MKPGLFRSRRTRTVAIAAAITVLAIAAWTASGSDADGTHKTAPAVVADIEDTVIATGTLDASQMVDVGAQASGQIKSLKVALGDRVKTGDLIAEIDATQQQNDVRDAQAELNSLRAQRARQLAALNRDRRIFERQTAMLAQQATARADYEAAQATLAASQAQVETTDAQIMQSQIRLDTLQAKLGYTRITAPIDGTVVAVVTREGQTVNAAQSAPTIVKLAKLDVMLVRAAISEADVVKVRPGQAVYFTILGNPDKRYRGKLKAVEPAPDSITSADNGYAGAASTGRGAEAVYYNGLFEVPNPGGELRIAMTAQVHVVLAHARNALTIPSAALGDKADDGSYAITVIDADGTPVPRRIRVGIDNSTQAQVLSGLKAGEQVVVGTKAADGDDSSDSTGSEA